MEGKCRESWETYLRSQPCRMNPNAHCWCPGHAWEGCGAYTLVFGSSRWGLMWTVSFIQRKHFGSLFRLCWALCETTRWFRCCDNCCSDRTSCVSPLFINRSLVDHCILTSSFFTRGHFLIGQNIIKNHTLKDSGGNILVVSMCVCSHVRNASDQLRDHSFVQMNMET
jgi:hypothetical protein